MFRATATTATTLAAIILLSLTTHSASLHTDNQNFSIPSAAATPLYVSLSSDQAQMVTTLTELIRAYNAGRLEDALALLDDNVGWSDCDFQNVSVVNFVGKTKVTDWLQRRFADHDFLEVATIQMASIENQEPTSKNVIGVEYLYRTSDTLKILGFVNGIKPPLASKVVFTKSHDLILRFANGPYGASTELCRPSKILGAMEPR